MELDRFDRQLLNLIQADVGQTAEQLAEQVGLSPSAIQRRLRRMREQGLIVRDIALVDPARIGPTTLFIVSVQVERERPELLARFREWLAAQETVQQAFYVTGESDFILVVTAPDTEAYDAMMTRLVSENPNVKRFTTNVVLSPIKRGQMIPIPLSAEG
jgi:DNA-binding Lrp family transcriptional regulator